MRKQAAERDGPGCRPQHRFAAAVEAFENVQLGQFGKVFAYRLI
jgi:hypothetical protein